LGKGGKQEVSRVVIPSEALAQKFRLASYESGERAVEGPLPCETLCRLVITKGFSPEGSAVLIGERLSRCLPFNGAIAEQFCYRFVSPAAMARIEKTVFISYRRNNAPWVLAISQNLTHSGFDVFFDYSGLASGDFETAILDNIHSRAHFLVLLTPSALDRCNDPSDWLRREIEAAVDSRRNIVPLILEGFNFDTPSIANQLTGKLASLRRYNAMTVSAEYFDAAMDRLRNRFLSVALETVVQPPSPVAVQAAAEAKAAAAQAPAVAEEELTAQQWFERGYESTDPDDAIRFYTKAIDLKADFAVAYFNRGIAFHEKAYADQAIKDYDEVLRITPLAADALTNRGIARLDLGDPGGALADFERAIQLNATDAGAFYNRGIAHEALGNVEAALLDYDKTLQLQPKYCEALINRANILSDKGDFVGALRDYDQAIQLSPRDVDALSNRGLTYLEKGDAASAIRDLGMAIAIKPSADCFNVRGDARRQMQDLAGALEDYNQALQLQPDFREALESRDNLLKAIADRPKS
jgi:tetratricopeptide (TPR) repeat protein